MKHVTSSSSSSSHHEETKGEKVTRDLRLQKKEGRQGKDKDDLIRGDSGDGSQDVRERRIEQDSVMIIAEQILESPWFMGVSLMVGAMAIAAVSAGVTILIMRSSKR